MKLTKIHAVYLTAAVLLLGLTYVPLFATERTLDTFAREDGIFENLTSVYLFATSLIFVAAFFRFRTASWLLRLSYAGLALLFFLGAGEEISWGERIFHWDDHNYIRSINVQDELTIHNLKYFQGDEAIIPISTSQMFTVFAFTLAVLIPLACRLSSKIERLVAPHFPVLPLEPGILVLATYFFQKVMVRLLPVFPALYQHPSMPIPQGVHEIREHGYSFALLVSAALYLLRQRSEKKVGESRQRPVEVTSS
ncbi:MAG TPA: hypothetical protein VGK56_00195 [Anaerolineales bacterium]